MFEKTCFRPQITAYINFKLNTKFSTIVDLISQLIHAWIHKYNSKSQNNHKYPKHHEPSKNSPVPLATTNITWKNSCNTSHLQTLQAIQMKMYLSSPPLLAPDCSNPFSSLATGSESWASRKFIRSMDSAKSGVLVKASHPILLPYIIGR